MLAPRTLLHWRFLRDVDRLALTAVALGGAAFALYSVAFVYGRVALVILLYFLTPVWSTLIWRVVMGWPASPMRIAAIVVGVAGLLIMLGADGAVPFPKSLGEWMGLLAGLLWSVATTGMRTRPALLPLTAAFFFAVGAMVTAIILSAILDPAPASGKELNLMAVLAVAVAVGGLWWVLSTSALMWATARLEPARVGILLMTEVIVGATSAAVLASEGLSPLEYVGGAMVLLAGALEVWPQRSRTRRSGTAPQDNA